MSRKIYEVKIENVERDRLEIKYLEEYKRENRRQLSNRNRLIILELRKDKIIDSNS